MWILSVAQKVTYCSFKIKNVNNSNKNTWMLHPFAGFTVSSSRAWWTVMRRLWTCWGPVWCPDLAQRWPFSSSFCRTNPAPRLLLLLPFQLEWRAEGAHGCQWAHTCIRSSLVYATETLPAILARSVPLVTAPNSHSDPETTHTPQKHKPTVVSSLGYLRIIPLQTGK